MIGKKAEPREWPSISGLPGNVAFDHEINPTDFLDSRIAISGFRNYGGITKLSVEDNVKEWTRFNKEDDILAAIDDPDVLERTLAEFDSRPNSIASHLGVQKYIHYDLNVGLESNQRLSQRQWTYGAQLALDIKAYDENSSFVKGNIFDYPFALVRLLSGYNNTQEIIPLGISLPTLIVGVDQVDPKNNVSREKLREMGNFDRFRSEVYFRTPVARVGEQEVFFNFDLRYLRELDAPNAIEKADLHEHIFYVATISSTNGVFFSYSDGKLPFDLEDQQSYELGWKFHF